MAICLFAPAARSQSSFLIPVQTTTGQGISGATVTLTCTDTTNGCVGKGPFSATSTNGNAAFTAIPAGNYTVAITGPNLTTFSYAYTVASQANGGTLNPSNLGGIVVVDGSTYPKTQVGIQNAVNAAGCNGKVILTPGVYNLTDTSAAQEILLTNSVGVANCGIDFGGPGAEGTVILQYATNVPNTEDIIRVSPGSSTATFGVYLHDFFIQPVSASTTAARYGINFDETNGLIAHVTVERIRIGLNASNLQSNYAVFNTNTVPSCNPLFLATFTDNTFWGGVSFLNVGDSIVFGPRNNITGPRDFTVQGVSTGCHTDGGAHGFQAFANNLTPTGGVVIKNAWQGWFAYNDIEATATSTEANNCLVDVQGTGGSKTANFIIEGNYLGANSTFVGCAVRADQTEALQIKNNYTVQGSVNAFTFTANADRTYFGFNRMAPDNVISSFLSDSGTSTAGDFFNQTTGVVSHYGTQGYSSAAGTTGVAISSTQVKVNNANGLFCVSTGDPTATACDTGLSRLQAGYWAVGNGAFQDVSGTLDSSYYLMGGTKPTPTGTGACATFSTQVGGSSGGTFKCTGTSGAATITLTFTITAPNGFRCDFRDETTTADSILPTVPGAPTTTCTATAAAVASGDVISFTSFPF